MLAGVHALALPHELSPLGRLSLSIGVVQVRPQAVEGGGPSVVDSVNMALRQADALLYQAKAQGRNCAVWAPDSGEKFY